MQKEDLKAQDLMVKNPLNEKKKEFESARKVDSRKKIPNGYVEVKLSSKGKLGLPEIIHVRDYTYEDALIIADIQENKITDGVIEILNNVVLEDIDMGKAHLQDVMEIFLTIYGTWYSPILDSFHYYLDITKTGKEKEAKENISVASIPVNNIKTIPFPEDVDAPIRFSNGEKEYVFTLQKIENDLLAWEFAVQNNLEEEYRISESIKAVKSKSYTEEQLEEYTQFASKRGKDFLKAIKALSIVSVDDKEPAGLEEALEMLKEIPLSIWSALSDVVEKRFKFGVVEEVKFTCSITNEKIERRFQFRPFHFLPVLDQTANTGFNISFG
jgi:hypothetical protein